MKFRCPYCGKIMERIENSLCPFCSKAVRLPEPPRKEEYVPRAKRSTVTKSGGGGPLGFFSLFTERPSFLFWLIGISVVAGLVLLVFSFKARLDTGAPANLRRFLTAEQRTSEELGRLHTALQWFRQTSNRFPSAEEGLDVLMTSHAPGWLAPFVNEVPYDLWGSLFQYSCSNDTVRLFSCGKDKLAGTADDIVSPGPDYKGVVERLSLTPVVTNTTAVTN